LNLVKSAVRTTTGSNLRSIMLLAGKNIIQEVLSSTIVVEYHKPEEEQNWKTILLGEIIDILHDEKTIDGLEKHELEDILDWMMIFFFSSWFLSGPGSFCLETVSPIT
jgi:hypothetical protein